MAQWEYQRSDGAWSAMQPNDSASLEEAFSAFRACQLQLGTDDHMYEVDFVHMTRRNLENGQERPIRRLTPAGQPAQWEVMREVWKLPSDIRDQRRLEDAYVACRTCSLEIGGQQYAVDFAVMQQTSQTTGYVRNLRRVPLKHFEAVPSADISDTLHAPQRVVLVRHGEGIHNATENYGIVDPPLTAKGIEQAKSLRGNPSLEGCELLVVSPLQRAIHTAATVFGEQPVCRTVISALCTERWSARCDEGRPKAQLVADHPFVAAWEGWVELSEDIWWGTRTSDREWESERLPAFYDWLRAQPERKIVVVGHGGFFAPLAGKHLGNCEAIEIVAGT